MTMYGANASPTVAPSAPSIAVATFIAGDPVRYTPAAVPAARAAARFLKGISIPEESVVGFEGAVRFVNGVVISEDSTPV